MCHRHHHLKFSACILSSVIRRSSSTAAGCLPVTICGMTGHKPVWDTHGLHAVLWPWARNALWLQFPAWHRDPWAAVPGTPSPHSDISHDRRRGPWGLPASLRSTCGRLCPKFSAAPAVMQSAGPAGTHISPAPPYSSSLPEVGGCTPSGSSPNLSRPRPRPVKFQGQKETLLCPPGPWTPQGSGPLAEAGSLTAGPAKVCCWAASLSLLHLSSGCVSQHLLAGLSLPRFFCN